MRAHARHARTRSTYTHTLDVRAHTATRSSHEPLMTIDDVAIAVRDVAIAIHERVDRHHEGAPSPFHEALLVAHGIADPVHEIAHCRPRHRPSRSTNPAMLRSGSRARSRRKPPISVGP